MLLFEVKKILSKPANKIALVILAGILIFVSFLAVDGVRYTDEEGNEITGVRAARNLRDDKNQWAGYVTEDVLKKVIEENTTNINSEEYLSDDIQEKNKAFHKAQGYADLRDMISDAFSEYDELDYYRVDNVTVEEVSQFYERRILNLKEYISSGEEYFTDAEKEFLISQYNELKTPFYYEYKDGWETLLSLSYTSTIIIILALVIGFLVSGIFSDEFHLKADSIFFSTKLGRNRAVRSKIGAGFLVVTAIYWIVILLYSVIVLGGLGFGGAGCPIQMSIWDCYYNISYFQAYMLVILGGYVATLFILTLSMLVSALTHSTVITMTIPFIFTCVTPFVGRIPFLASIISLFPGQLLLIYQILKYFGLYEIGGKVIDSIPILFAVYLMLFFVLLPILYLVYRKAKVK